MAAARVMRFTDGIDSQLALGRILTFDVSPTRRLPYTLNSVSEPLSGNKVWRGSLQGGYWGELSLVRGREYLTGGLQIYGPGFAAQYGFEVLGNGYYLVIYIDYRKFPPD